MRLPVLAALACTTLLAACGGARPSTDAPEAVAPAAQPSSVPEVFRLISGSPGVTWIVLEPVPRTERLWQWTERAPHSYVQFDTAAAPALPRPRTFTLVGAASPCVVTTAKTSYLRASTEVGIFRVIEVAPTTCALSSMLAVEGEDAAPSAQAPTSEQSASARIARWTVQVTGHRLDEGFGDTGPGAWVETFPDLHVEAIIADLIVETPPRTVSRVLLLRHRGELLARFGGADVAVIGQLTWAGRDHVIAHDQTRAWAVRIPP